MNRSRMIHARSPALRRRRRMFSTSITASSTTTPSATTRPPSVMVLRPSPKASRIQTVVSSVSGIALKETSAPRQSRNVTQQQRNDQHRADGSELRSFSIALSMKLAGRSSAGWYIDSLLASAGASASSRCFERARHLERVGAELRRGLDQDAGLAADQRVAEARLGAVADRGHVAEPHRQPARVPSTACASASSVAPGACAWMHDALRRRLEVAAADQRGRAPGGRRTRRRASKPDRGQLDRIDRRSAARALRRRRSAPAPRRGPRGFAA